MAVTYNFTNGSIDGQPKVNDTLPNTTGIFCRSNTVDFANQNLDSGNSDIAQVINVPADTWFLSVMGRIITAETDNAQVNIGYGADPDHWVDDDGCDAADLAAGEELLPIWVAPMYFAAADTVDVATGTNDIDYDALKLEVIAIMLPGNQSDADGSSQHST